jgi:hypothetical protein
VMSASASGISAKRRKLEYGHVSDLVIYDSRCGKRTPKFHPK